MTLRALIKEMQHIVWDSRWGIQDNTYSIILVHLRLLIVNNVSMLQQDAHPEVSQVPEKVSFV